MPSSAESILPTYPGSPLVLAIRVAIRALDGNPEVDGRGQSAPLTADTGIEGGFMALMAVVFVIEAHVSRSFPLDDDRRMVQAGAGGARSRAIRHRIYPNIRRDTATSAIWNVTLRPWLTIFAPILISFSRSVVSDQCAMVRGRASVRVKLARL